jgi:protein tyrosine/serine phosphatase
MGRVADRSHATLTVRHGRGTTAVDGWERHVRFEACFNFRDLGGYPTADGREVRRGVLYRSDSLHRLSDDDLASFTALGIRTVIDLRTSDELAEHGRVADDDARTFRHVPFDEVAHDGYLRPHAQEYLAFADLRRDRIAHALQHLAEGDGPFVFHCMAGKDRTGVLAAILLAALGVNDDTIGADYALTERSIDPAFTWAKANDADWAAWLTRVEPTGLLTAHAEVIVEFLALVRADYGTIDDYLRNAGLNAGTVQALRERYLA